MQSGWLRQFFHQHDAQCGHGVVADPTAEVKAEDDVSRRDFVKTGFAAGVAAGMAAGTVVAQTSPAAAQPANPMGRDWWPSRWGAADEKGAYNRQTPAKAMEAARLVKTGRIYPLSQALEVGIPLFGARHISLTIPGGPTGGPFGTHNLYFNDEMFSGEIGQVGSQFDGLGHIGAKVGNEIRYYNGLTQASGRRRLRAEKARHSEPRPHLYPWHHARHRHPQGHGPSCHRLHRDHGGRPARRFPGRASASRAKGTWCSSTPVTASSGRPTIVEYNKGCPGPSNTVANWLVG